MSCGLLWDYWPKAAEWFLIGGPDDEAQEVVQRCPHVKCLGCEPNPVLFRRQQAASFPGTLVECALWSQNIEGLTLTYLDGRENSGSLCAPEVRPDYHGADLQQLQPDVRRRRVSGRSLDDLSRKHGPFRNNVLWLDIEFAEVEALRGAEQVLENTLLVNVETYAHMNLTHVVRLLRRHGLYLADVWNAGPDWGKDAQDYLFVRN